MKLLIICGPTATGKTELAIELARKFDGEIISADSRQVYRGMDIGTGKDLPSKEIIEKLRFTTNTRNSRFELVPYKISGIPIWLYDIVSPKEPFSVSIYRHLAWAVIANIHKANKLAIVVGGTGLYIDSLFTQKDTFAVPPDPELRQQLAPLSLSVLQKLLADEAFEAWQDLNVSDRRNQRRLIRKIEIARYQKLNPEHYDNKVTKIRFSANLLETSRHILKIGLTAPYPELYRRIDIRVDKRVKQGILSEIQRLLDQGYHWDLPALQTLGYQEWQGYFRLIDDKWQVTADETLLQEIIQKWKFAEHGFARRQMTWFRKMSGILWFDVEVAGFASRIEGLVGKWYTSK